MKLVEILARELEEWPEGDCAALAQDNSWTAWSWKLTDISYNNEDGCWFHASGDGLSDNAELEHEVSGLASDHSTAIITRADWEAERARIKVKPKAKKDGWLRHRGGKCPVEAGTLVDVRLRSGEIMLGVEAMTGWANSWSHDESPHDTMAWRPHKAEQNAHEQAFDACVEKCASTEPGEPEIPAAKQDSPLQWRDRVQEINRKMADLRAEKAGLIIKLSDEGFTLIGEQPF